MATYFPFAVQPDFSERIAIHPTLRNMLGQNVMATRKQFEKTHRIVYTYFKLSNRQYRIIDNHIGSVNGGVTSFYLVHWGEPKIVKAIDTKGYITLNNISKLSANTGDGGNRICLWKNSGDYNNDNTVSGNVITDVQKSWTINEWQNHKISDSNGIEFNASQNTSNTLTHNASPSGTFYPGAYELYRYENHTIATINVTTRVVTLNASITMSYSAGEQFVMPVYEVFYEKDALELEQTGEWNLEKNDNYGPFFSGELAFSQRGSN